MRIGINIPKELHQRLQPLKETMNVSQICREALEAHVGKYEGFIGWLETDGAKEIAAKVCEEELKRKAMVEVDWEMLGYQDAKGWVQRATSFDWDYWKRYQNDPYRQKGLWAFGRLVHSGISKVEWAYPEGVKLFHQRFREYTDLIHKQSTDFLEWMDEEYDGMGPVYDHGAAERDYGRGWVALTTAAWEMICQLREEYERRWKHDGAEVHRNWPKPEVPEHILADIQQGR